MGEKERQQQPPPPQPQPKPAPKESTEGGDVLEQATEQGFIGTEVDPTPNENYTVEGVTSGKPTPETDEEAKAKAAEAAARLQAQAEGGEAS